MRSLIAVAVLLTAGCAGNVTGPTPDLLVATPPPAGTVQPVAVGQPVYYVPPESLVAVPDPGKPAPAPTTPPAACAVQPADCRIAGCSTGEVCLPAWMTPEGCPVYACTVKGPSH